MAIAYDNTSNSGAKTGIDGTVWSWSHTTAGSNRLLVVGVSMSDTTDADRTVNSVTYNGVNMVSIREDDNDADNGSTSLWYLANPASGANTVEVTLNGACSNVIGMAISLTGVDQTNPLDAQNGTTTSNTEPSTTVTTVADNCWVVDVVIMLGSGTLVVGADQTERQNNSIGTNKAGMSHEGPKTPAGGVAMSWSESGIFNPDWAISAASFMPVSAGSSADIPTPRMTPDLFWKPI